MAGAFPGKATRRDFFISYTSSDRQWAEWIAWQLEAAGFTTLLQAWDFVPGVNFVVEMNQAVQDCSRTIAVLSEQFMESGFATAEWASAFGADPQAANKKLLPVRIDKCMPSGLLAQIVYLDLSDADDEASAKATLLQRVTSERLKPAQQPRFPTRRSVFPRERGGEPTPSVVQATRVRFVQAEVSANGIGELSPYYHPYRPTRDATDDVAEVETPQVSVFLFMPHSSFLKSTPQPFAVPAAYCVPRPENTVNALKEHLGDRGFSKLLQRPSELTNEEKLRAIDSLSAAEPFCFLAAAALPQSVLGPARRDLGIAYQAMTSLFLLPLVEMHRKLDVPRLHIHLKSVGDSCDKQLLGLMKKVLKVSFARKRAGSTVSIESVNSAALCGVARFASWCVSTRYNEGKRDWVDALESALTRTGD